MRAITNSGINTVRGKTGGSIEQYVNANVAQLAAELGAVFPKKPWMPIAGL